MTSVLKVADWQTVRFLDIFRVDSGVPGTKYAAGGHTEFSQLAFKERGQTAIVYDGKPIDFSPGSVVYLPKEAHSEIDYRKTIVTHGSSICLFFDAPVPLYTSAFAVYPQSKAVGELFCRLLALWKSRKNDDFLLYASFFELLALVNDTLSAPEKPSVLVCEAKAFLTAHACDAFIDFDALAGRFGISTDRFRRVFKASVGISPFSFYAEAKTERIKRLLRENSASLTDIAALTGFAELNYFSRFFKKHTGLSASDYRRRYSESL